MAAAICLTASLHFTNNLGLAKYQYSDRARGGGEPREPPLPRVAAFYVRRFSTLHVTESGSTEHADQCFGGAEQ